MKKIILSVLIISAFSLLFAKDKSQEIHVGLLNGPSCIPAAYLMENCKELKGEEKSSKISYEIYADPQTLLPKLIKNEADIGFMPVNVAAKVYNSGNKVLLCCAVTGLGNLTIITKDKNLHRFKDLRGKTIYTAGQGATPEYMLRYLLSKNKLTAGQTDNSNVKLNFSIPTSQLAAQLISGKIDYAAVPEPFATIAKMKSSEIVSALDFQKEFIEVTGSKNIYPLTVMVVRADFAEKNPELLEAFLKEYETAVAWTVKNPIGAALLTEKHSLGLDAAIVEKAIPVSNYTFVRSEAAVSSVEELLNIFIECDPSSIGGKLPEKSFYYTK